MKTIQISVLITLLSVSSPIALVHASESSEKNDVIHTQEDVNAIVPPSNSLRGAVNSAWNFIVASDGDNNNDEEDVMLMCTENSFPCHGTYRYCFGGNGCCDSCSPTATCLADTSTCSYESSGGDGENNVVGRDAMASLD